MINPKDRIFFLILCQIILVQNAVFYLFNMEAKKVKDSLVTMTELVLPNDTNLFDNLMGGRLMYWMDIAAALSATKHCGAPVVTASVDNLSFQNPIHIGNVVTIHAKVTRAFNTSMEIYLQVWGENPIEQRKYRSNEAFSTFVALNSEGKPQQVPPAMAETEEEKKLYEEALHRRQIRLILDGKLKGKDASEDLKSFFLNS